MFRVGISDKPPLNWELKFPGVVWIWCDGQIPDRLPSIDLKTEPGGRAYVAESQDDEGDWNTEIVFQVHHAVADGRGGVEIFRDFFLAYDNLVAGRPIDKGLPRLEPELLSQRNTLGLTEWKYWKHLPKQPIAAFGVTKFLFRNFLKLVSQPADQAPTTTTTASFRFPQWRGQWLSESETTKIVENAGKRKIGINSFMFGTLFQTLEQWKQEVLGNADDEWIRMILPMNLRERKFLRMPAANRSTIVQLDRRRSQIEDEDNFLFYLDREINLIRAWKFDRIFLMVIRLMATSQSSLKKSSKKPQSRGTAVFTNLGEPLRWARKKNWLMPDGKSLKIGDVVLTNFDFTGPVRRGTPLNLCVQKQGECLRLTLHWSPKELSKTDADWILERFIQLATAQ